VRHKLFCLDASKLAPGVHFLDQRRFILHVSEQGALRATHNRCRHQAGRFVAAAGCAVRCPWHGWELDLERMTYTNPASHPSQPELEVERSGDWITLWETRDQPAWQSDARAPAALEAGELRVRYYAHACLAIQAAGYTLFTDPWLEGPAFTRGWWLSHRPPPGALDELARADLIYISHNHSDHLNPATLRRLAERNRDVAIIVPHFETHDIVCSVERHGLRNVRAVPFESWLQLSPDFRIMLLRDAAAPGDSGLLAEYKGRRILNAVDCSDLNSGQLPDGIDLLASSFSRGASGFPVCWGELLDPAAMQAWIEKDHANVIRRVKEAVRRCAPRAYLPFASFFTEAHPADTEIRSLNRKVRPDEIGAALARSSPETQTWLARPGEWLDLSDLSRSGGREPVPPEWDFATYLAPVEACRHFAPLDRPEGILRYFEWAGFRSDLILHLIETDDDFQALGQAWLIDLAGPRLLRARPGTPHRYLRLRVRGDVFRHTLRYGLPWDEISIGFNARMYREPNVYNLDFWSHFQSRLPADPPWQGGSLADAPVAPDA
jgi:CMP-N-acetylneuraminate monooxygenase